ncbi:MAG: hypothetical protein ABH811_01085 [archaeon]
MNNIDSSLYPNFQWVKQREAFFLNAYLPKDYKTKIPKFYESKGKDKLEKIAQNLSNSMEDSFGKPEIKLQWDNTKGLTAISIGPSGGCYLNRFSFQEHNLGTKTSLMSSVIIINYINELLKI